MRSDMAKVIVERPRHQSWKDYRPLRSSRKHDLSEDAPTKESMRKGHGGRRDGKSLNENLTPLERFLRSKIGHRWSDVYSELNEHVSVRNAVQAHVRQHLESMVELNPVRNRNGDPCYGSTWRKELVPLRCGQLFVEEDILKVVKRPKKAKKRPRGWKKYHVVGVRRSKPACVSFGLGEMRTYRYSLSVEIMTQDELSEFKERTSLSPKVITTFEAPSRTIAESFLSDGRWTPWHAEENVVRSHSYNFHPGRDYFPE